MQRGKQMTEPEFVARILRIRFDPNEETLRYGGVPLSNPDPLAIAIASGGQNLLHVAARHALTENDQLSCANKDDDVVDFDFRGRLMLANTDSDSSDSAFSQIGESDSDSVSSVIKRLEKRDVNSFADETDDLVDRACKLQPDEDDAGAGGRLIRLLGVAKPTLLQTEPFDDDTNTIDPLTGWSMLNPVILFPSDNIIDFETLWDLYALVGIEYDPTTGEKLEGWNFVKDERDPKSLSPHTTDNVLIGNSAASVLLSILKNSKRERLPFLARWLAEERDVNNAINTMLRRDGAGRAMRLQAMLPQAALWKSGPQCSIGDFERFRKFFGKATPIEINAVCALKHSLLSDIGVNNKNGGISDEMLRTMGIEIPDFREGDRELEKLYASSDSKTASGFRAWINLFRELFIDRALSGVKTIWDAIKDILPAIYAMFERGFGAIEQMSKESGIKGWLAYFVMFILNSGMTIAEYTTWFVKVVASFPISVAKGVMRMYQKTKSSPIMLIITFAIAQALAYARWMIDMYARDPRQTIRFLKVLQLVRNQLCRYVADQYFLLIEGEGKVPEATWAEAASDFTGHLGETAQMTATSHLREQLAPGGKLEKLWATASGKGVKLLSDGAKGIPFVGGFVGSLVEIIGDAASEAMRESAEIMLMAQEASQVSGLALDIISPAACYDIGMKRRRNQMQKAQQVLAQIET